MARTFCNVENTAFDASQFTAGPGNVTIHVTDNPHTLDGWAAHRTAHGWAVTAPKLPQIDTIDFTGEP